MKQVDTMVAVHEMASRSSQLGTTCLLALSMMGATFTPNFIVERFDAQWQCNMGGLGFIHKTTNRLMSWSVLVGGMLGARHLASFPLALRSSCPSKVAQDAAMIPALLSSVVHVCCGAVSAGEGIMIGTGSYGQVALGMVLASTACLAALSLLPCKFGLMGVWMSLIVFNAVQLASILVHQRITGPLAVPSNLHRNEFTMNGQKVQYQRLLCSTLALE